MADHLRSIALGADQGAVRNQLDSVARYSPLVADVSGTNLVLARQRLVLERIQMKGHLLRV